jgi:phosphohistidine phosphatase
MELYLIRHAEASPIGEHGVTEDEDRPLTPDGERQSEALGRFLKKRKLAFDLIVTSPLVRARRTAELFIKTSGMKDVTVEETSALSPNARPKKLSRHLLKGAAEKVALVGHLPHLALFAAWVVGGKKAQLDLTKAGMAHISCGDSPIKGNGVLHWLVTPEFYE